MLVGLVCHADGHAAGRIVFVAMNLACHVDGYIISVVSVALFARYFMFLKLSTCFFAQVFHK